MASSLIATSAIETLVQSGLPEEALDVYVDAADQRIVSLIGPHSGDRTESFYDHNRSYYDGGRPTHKHLFLSHPAESIVSVVIDGATLEASAYRLEHGGRMLTRVGDYIEWHGDITVVYAPAFETARRLNAIVELVKLAVASDGYRRVQTGAQHIREPLHREREERRILKGLQPQYGGGALLV